MLIVYVGFVTICIILIMSTLCFVSFCECVYVMFFFSFFLLFLLLCLFFLFLSWASLNVYVVEMDVLWRNCIILCKMYKCGKEVARE